MDRDLKWAYGVIAALCVLVAAAAVWLWVLIV